MQKPELDMLLNEYYNCFHDSLQQGGIQGFGQRVMNAKLESYWDSCKPQTTLEIGFGNGFHLRAVKDWPTQIYIGLDKRIIPIKDRINLENSKLVTVEGDIHGLPFPDGSIDRILMTCIFHHLENPYGAACEISRVLHRQGEVSILLPTDPGIINRFIKYFTVHRKAKKYKNYDSRTIYALDHRNHIHSLLQILNYVFDEDSIKVHYFPFSFLRSWNLNLFVIVRISRSA